MPNNSQQNFLKNTHKLPLLLFLWFMTVAVLLAATLSHDHRTWNGFWHRPATLPRDFFSSWPLLRAIDHFCSALNAVLVRGGWIVALALLLALQSVYLRLLTGKREHCRQLRFVCALSWQRLVAIEAAILFGASAFFLALTWGFTALSAVIGSCLLEDGKTVRFPVSPGECRGGQFHGFDISGHCFLIVHSCLLVMEVTVKAWYVWRCPIDSASPMALLKEKDSDLEDQLAEAEVFDGTLLPVVSIQAVPSYTAPLIAVTVLAVLLILGEVGIFLQTLLFFHTVTEKLLGTVLGSAYWGLLFGLSFKYPHLF